MSYVFISRPDGSQYGDGVGERECCGLSSKHIILYYYRCIFLGFFSRFRYFSIGDLGILPEKCTDLLG